MNLYNLADEYFETSRMIEKKIAVLKSQLPVTRGQESIILTRRIAELSKQKYDLHNTGHYLKNYYLH